MKETTKLKLEVLLGVIISSTICGPFLWNGPMADAPAGAKIGAIIFVALMALYYAMTHRTPEKTKLEDQVRLEKWLRRK
jgi:purine-cytosine permease-like protein